MWRVPRVHLAASITRGVKGEGNSKREKGRKNGEAGGEGEGGVGVRKRDVRDENDQRREKKEARKVRARRMLDVINDKIGAPTKPRGSKLKPNSN